MSDQPAARTSELVVCPSCGAAVARSDKLCWLCRWDLREEIVTAEMVSEPPGSASAATRTPLILGLIVLAVVTVGTFVAAPGIGILMAVVLILALFGAARAFQEGPASGPRQALDGAYASPLGQESYATSNVAVQVLKTLGVIALLGLASIVAFLAFCAVCVFAVSNM